MADNLVFRKPPSIPLPYSRAARTFTHPSPSNRQTLLLPGSGDQCLGTTNGSPKKFTSGWPHPLVVGFNSPRQGLANLSLVRNFPLYDNGWIYHAKLGWAYAQPDGSGGLWLWMKDHRWTWTTGRLPTFGNTKPPPGTTRSARKTDNPFYEWKNPPRRPAPSQGFQFLSAHTLGNFTVSLQLGLIAKGIVLRLAVVIGALHGGGILRLFFHLLDLLGNSLRPVPCSVASFSCSLVWTCYRADRFLASLGELILPTSRRHLRRIR